MSVNNNNNNNNNSNNNNILNSSSSTAVVTAAHTFASSSWSPVYSSAKDTLNCSSSNNNNNNSYSSIILESYESSLVPNICPNAPNNYTSYLIGLYHHDTFENEDDNTFSFNEAGSDINNYGSMFDLIKSNPVSLSNCPNSAAQTVPSL